MFCTPRIKELNISCWPIFPDGRKWNGFDPSRRIITRARLFCIGIHTYIYVRGRRRRRRKLYLFCHALVNFVHRPSGKYRTEDIRKQISLIVLCGFLSLSAGNNLMLYSSVRLDTPSPKFTGIVLSAGCNLSSHSSQLFFFLVWLVQQCQQDAHVQHTPSPAWYIDEVLLFFFKARIGTGTGLSWETLSIYWRFSHHQYNILMMMDEWKERNIYFSS